ncbi:MAG: metal-sulfur cluster assembly factor [Candidatus Magasanikbacteria bacterium]|nr:metal-sulfur cluster assembly factor [Candidatus Magasanikbacteria bacterium]
MLNKKTFPIPPEKRTQEYWKILNTIFDPEMGMGIVELGLIYNVEIKNGQALVTMTFTSMGCPYGASLIEQIKEEMKKLPKVKKVVVDLVWEPIWTLDRMDPDARALLPF